MLTLTRKPDETIIIGDGEDQIEVTVKEIRRNQVRLGITAPNHIKIFRKELLERSDGTGAQEASERLSADAQ